MYSKDRTQIIDRREMLKIKVNSLTAEAKIIRQAERKLGGQLREEMYLHRVKVVRGEARHASLALGFIKGRTHNEMELNATSQKERDRPDMKKIVAMISKYGPANFVMPTESTPARKARQERGRLKMEDTKQARSKARLQRKQAVA